MISKKDYYKEANEFYNQIAAIHSEKAKFWVENVLFTWQWWLGAGLTVVPWILWFFYRKKESTYRLLAAGLFAMVISSWLDFLGVALNLWHYNYDVLPFLPSYLPWDFTLIPVIIMTLIQFKPHINPFIKAIVFAGLSSFVGEPFFKWIGTYDPEQWKYIYSFPILIIIYLIAHFICSRNQFDKIR